MTLAQQVFHQMGADEPRPSGYQYAFHPGFSFSRNILSHCNRPWPLGKFQIDSFSQLIDNITRLWAEFAKISDKKSLIKRVDNGWI
jgi:hypothetical protein